MFINRVKLAGACCVFILCTVSVNSLYVHYCIKKTYRTRSVVSDGSKVYIVVALVRVCAMGGWRGKAPLLLGLLAFPSTPLGRWAFCARGGGGGMPCGSRSPHGGHGLPMYHLSIKYSLKQIPATCYFLFIFLTSLKVRYTDYIIFPCWCF
jgi:uncharacterized membrane protein